MKKTYFQKGFTLIELLVVIAIIGILSSVVLASLSTARNKGKDAAVQGQLSSLRDAAEIYYSTNSKYSTTGAINVCGGSGGGGFFGDTASNGLGLIAAISASSNGTAGTYTNMTCAINAAGDAWAATAKLPGAGTWFCVDSSGKAQGGYASMTAALTADTDTTCN